MPKRPDLDEPFSVHPHSGEDVLRRLLGVEPDAKGEDEEPSEEED